MSIVELVGFISEWLGVAAVTHILSMLPQVRERRPVDFHFRRREALISFSLFGVVLLAAVIFYFKQSVFHPEGLDPLVSSVWIQLILAVACLAILAALMVIRRQPMLSIGWSRQMLRPAIQISLPLILLTIFLRGKIYSLLDGITQGEIVVLFAWLGIALAEETIFRGFIQTRLSAYWGEQRGWFFTALLFVIWKLPRLIAVVGLMPYGLLVVVAQALLVGWMMKKLGHVLAPSIYRAISEWLILLI